MPTPSEVLAFLELFIDKYGLVIVPIGAFLENSVILGFIFPGVTVIFLSGYVARTTGENLYLVILLASLGSILGDNFDYFLGKYAGGIFLKKPIFAKPISLVEPFVRKHGIWAVFIGRFSAWSRAWVALFCGAVNFSYWKFFASSVISACVWTSVWIIGGFLLGANRTLIEEWLTRGSVIIWIGIFALFIYYFRTRIIIVSDLFRFIKKYAKRS